MELSMHNVQSIVVHRRRVHENFAVLDLVITDKDGQVMTVVCFGSEPDDLAIVGSSTRSVPWQYPED